MTLWDKLNQINNESYSTISVKLVINHLSITDWIDYSSFEIYISAEVLSLEDDEYSLEEFYSEYTEKTNRYFRITINRKEVFE